MVTTASKAVRDSIVTILSNMTAVSDTKKTVMDSLRSSAQDWEGFIFRVRMRSSVSALVIDQSTRTMTEQWLIELWSPKTGLGNESKKENQMYDYRDKVMDTFQSNQNLSNTNGVTYALVTGDNVIWQSDESLDGNPRSKWTFALQIERTETC